MAGGLPNNVIFATGIGMDSTDSFVAMMADYFLQIQPAMPSALIEEIKRGDVGPDALLGLFREYARLREKPSWGIDLGMRFNLLEFGFFGYAVSSAPTLRHSLGLLVDYGVLVGSIYDYQLEENEQTLTISFTPAIDFSDMGAGVAEFAFSSLIKQVFAVTFGNLDQLKFGFMDAQPDYIQLLQEYLGGELLFNQSSFFMTIPSQYCDLPSPLYNREIWELSIQECRKQYSMTKYTYERLNIVDAVNGYIDSAILRNQQGVASYAALPTSAEVSSKLGISESYLRKQLLAEKTSFRQLKEERCQDWSLKLLKQEQLSIEQAAGVLGYSDTSNFSRAFKRWFGQGPAAVRSSD